MDGKVGEDFLLAEISGYTVLAYLLKLQDTFTEASVCVVSDSRTTKRMAIGKAMKIFILPGSVLATCKFFYFACWTQDHYTPLYTLLTIPYFVHMAWAYSTCIYDMHAQACYVLEHRIIVLQYSFVFCIYDIASLFDIFVTLIGTR